MFCWYYIFEILIHNLYLVLNLGVLMIILLCNSQLLDMIILYLSFFTTQLSIIFFFSRHMSISGDPSSPPVCACGIGMMIKLCAGEYSKNPGRYYYKCPVNSKHPKNFIWCDEYHTCFRSKTYKHECNTATSSTHPSCVSQSGATNETPLHHRRHFQSQVDDPQINNNLSFSSPSGKVEYNIPQLHSIMFWISIVTIVVFLAISLILLGVLLAKQA